MLNTTEITTPVLGKSSITKRRLAQAFNGVAIVCPSLGRQCGIARYSTYVANSLRRSGVKCDLYSRTDATPLKHYRIVIFQHEYGILDNFNTSLSSGETTAGALANLKSLKESGLAIALVMHTIDTENKLLGYINHQIFNSGILAFTLSMRGAVSLELPYIDHGVYNFCDPKSSYKKALRRYKQIKTDPTMSRAAACGFGLLSPIKQPQDLIELCKFANLGLIGNYATTDPSQKKLLKTACKDKSLIFHKIYHDFPEEDVLLERLQESILATAFQGQIHHYATSGSARLLLNLGCPLIVSDCLQFEDISCAFRTNNLKEASEYTKSILECDSNYEAECHRIYEYRKKYDIGNIYSKLIDHLLHDNSSASINFTSGGHINPYACHLSIPDSHAIRNRALPSSSGTLPSLPINHESACKPFHTINASPDSLFSYLLKSPWRDRLEQLAESTSSVSCNPYDYILDQEDYCLIEILSGYLYSISLGISQGTRGISILRQTDAMSLASQDFIYYCLGIPSLTVFSATTMRRIELEKLTVSRRASSALRSILDGEYPIGVRSTADIRIRSLILHDLLTSMELVEQVRFSSRLQLSRMTLLNSLLAKGFCKILQLRLSPLVAKGLRVDRILDYEYTRIY